MKEVQPTPVSVPAKPKRNPSYTLAPLEPGRYKDIKVFSGANINHGSRLLRSLFYDDYCSLSWNAVDRLIRDEFGNDELHLRLYGGGRKRVEWYRPPRLKEFEGKRDRKDYVQSVESLQHELEIKDNKVAQLEARLAQLEAEDEEPDEIEVPEEEPEPLTAFIKDLLSECGPLLRDMLRKGTSLRGAPPALGDPPPRNSQVDTNDGAVDGEVDIPDMVCQVFDRVDWTQTDHADLLGKLRSFGVFLGIHHKPGWIAQPFEDEESDPDEYDMPLDVWSYLDRVDWSRTDYRSLLEKLIAGAGGIGIVWKAGAMPA